MPKASTTPARAGHDTPGDGEWDEKAVVRRAQQGEMEACDQLIRHYQERIYGTIYHMISSHEDAADLAQDTFIKACRNIHKFKGNSSFFTWIYRIAVNNTINFIKARRRQAQFSLNEMNSGREEDQQLLELVSDKTPRREIALRELQQILNAAMQRLSPTHRLVVTLHDIQGLPHEEIGGIMDCNTNTVRTRLYYARQQLQAYISDYLK